MKTLKKLNLTASFEFNCLYKLCTIHCTIDYSFNPISTSSVSSSSSISLSKISSFPTSRSVFRSSPSAFELLAFAEARGAVWPTIWYKELIFFICFRDFKSLPYFSWMLRCRFKANLSENAAENKVYEFN